MQEIVIAIVGMSCQGCVKAVASVLEALPGVARVEVALAVGNARIAYDPALVGAEDLRAAIEAAGFQAT
jgi:copper chaperone CopZ